MPASLGSSTFDARAPATFACGTVTPSAAKLAAIEQGNAPSRNISTAAAFTVPVYWNVLYDGNNGEGGYPDAVITQTMNVINSYFNQIGLYFRLGMAPRRIPVSGSTLHSFDIGNDADRPLKQQYNQGNAQALNIYTVGVGPRGYAGWATFPNNYQSDPKKDGIMYVYNYLPGGNAGPAYTTGKIMVHEIGHWLGLYHTFQGGCVDGANGGDYVADTPAQASPSSGCPIGRDSCPGMPGLDPINNMMDYSDDTCRNTFTQGQVNRLAQQIYQYRGINLYN